jgi:Flp pilus assembly protein TadD
MEFSMNAKIAKIVCLVLFGVTFLIFMMSCSSTQNILGWPKSYDSRDNKIFGFLSNVRPHQGNPDSHYLLACYYQERGRHKEALEEFRKVLLIDPGYVKAYNGMGVSYDLLGDFSKAIEYYHITLELDTNLDYVYNNLGYSYLLQGNIDEAIVALKKAIDLNDKDKRFHSNLGLAYGEKGEFELALGELKIANIANDEADVHYDMAQLYFKKGLFDEARSHYGMALKQNPSLTIVRTGLKAADALVRIFEPIPVKVEPNQLIVPDQPKDAEETRSPEKEASTVSTKTPFETSQNGKLAIEISNGNGVNKMARMVGDYLEGRGFRVTRLTNAAYFNHTKTKIFYRKEYHDAADQVAEQLPVFQSKEETEGFDRANIAMKILIGKDLVPYYKLFENGKKS